MREKVLHLLGWGRGRGRGRSSGSSRGLSNIVIPIENASIDHFAKELQDIVNGENSEEHPYYKLCTKTKYKQIHYYFEKNEYTVNKPINPSTTGEESSVPSVSGEFASTSATEGLSMADQAQITLALSENPIVGVQEHYYSSNSRYTSSPSCTTYL